MIDFFTTAFPIEKPKWTTPNEVVLSTESFNLRVFNPERNGIPTLVLPPQAGHSSHIADYDHGQSLIKTILDNSGGAVYCIEWLPATLDRSLESINSLVLQVAQCVSYTGTPHLVGLCQGGWLAAIFTALYSANVESLMLVAAPIDFHKGGGQIYETITKLGMSPYREIVRANNGIMPGDAMLFGWKLMNPVDRFLGDYVDIWTDLLTCNFKKLKKVRKFRTWYEHTQDIAGAWYLEACEDLFLKNKLISNGIVLLGDVVELSDIDCKIALVAGEKDEITLPEQLFALTEHCGSKDTNIKTIPNCGHIGCFMGTKSQEYLADSVRWINE